MCMVVRMYWNYAWPILWYRCTQREYLLALRVEVKELGWERHLLAEGGRALRAANGDRHKAEAIGLKLGLQ